MVGLELWVSSGDKDQTGSCLRGVGCGVCGGAGSEL